MMDWKDRVALIALGEILYDHLREHEDVNDTRLLLSDRLRGAIDALAQGDQKI
jgi:hypothetical protein